MKHIVLTVLLALTLCSCLEVEQRYILRADGSLTVKNDIALDQSLLQMIAGMSNGDSSKGAFSMPAGEVTDALIDSLRDVFGGKNVAHYKTLPQVREASISDTVDLKGIHFRTSVTLNSYKDLYLVAQDTVPGAGSMLPKDSAIFIESGDSLIFQVEQKPDSASSLLSGMMTPTEDQPTVEPTKTKKGKNAKTKSSKKSKATKPVESVDSMANSLGSMMGDLFHFRIVVESPLLQGADTSAKYDAANRTATWTIDASNATKYMTNSPHMRAWFKKPN